MEKKKKKNKTQHFPLNSPSVLSPLCSPGMEVNKGDEEGEVGCHPRTLVSVHQVLAPRGQEARAVCTVLSLAVTGRRSGHDGTREREK